MDRLRLSGNAPGVRRRTVLAGASGALVASLVGCASGPDYPGGPLRIASGGREGVYYEYAHGIEAVVRAALPRLQPEVQQTKAGRENLDRLERGHAELAFTSVDEINIPVVALARIYESYLHLVVRRDRDIRRVADLRDRAVSIGASGSATELFATRVLELAGLDPEHDLRAVYWDPAPAADAVRTGRLDAMFFLGGIPTRAVANLVASGTPVALLDLREYVPELRNRHGELYLERTIPASAYGIGTPTVTAGQANYLVVSRDMDALVAYWLVRALFEHRDTLAAKHPMGARLNRREAINTYPLPLHLGAERYYRESKRQG